MSAPVKDYYHGLDLHQNELKQALLEGVTAFPASGKPGQVVYRSDKKQFYGCTPGNKWTRLGGSEYRANIEDFGVVEGSELSLDELNANTLALKAALESGSKLFAPGDYYAFGGEALITKGHIDLIGNGNTTFAPFNGGAVIKADYIANSAYQIRLFGINLESVTADNTYLVWAKGATRISLRFVRHTGVDFHNKVLYAENSTGIYIEDLVLRTGGGFYLNRCKRITIQGVHGVSTQIIPDNFQQNDQYAALNFRYCEGVTADNLYGEGYVHFWEMWGAPNAEAETNPSVPLSAGFACKNIHVRNLTAKRMKFSAFWGYSVENVHLEVFDFEDLGDVGPDVERAKNCSFKKGKIRDCGGFTGGAAMAVFWEHDNILFEDIESYISDASIDHPDPLNQVPDGQKKWSHFFLPSGIGTSPNGTAGSLKFNRVKFIAEKSIGPLVRFAMNRNSYTFTDCESLNTEINAGVCFSDQHLTFDGMKINFTNTIDRNIVAFVGLCGTSSLAKKLPGRLEMRRIVVRFAEGLNGNFSRVAFIPFMQSTDYYSEVIMENCEAYGETISLIDKYEFDPAKPGFVAPTYDTVPIMTIRNNIFSAGTWVSERTAGNYPPPFYVWQNNFKANGQPFDRGNVTGAVRLTDALDGGSTTRRIYAFTLPCPANPSSFAHALFTVNASQDAGNPFYWDFLVSSRFFGLKVISKLTGLSSLSERTVNLEIRRGGVDPGYDGPANPTDFSDQLLDVYVVVGPNWNYADIKIHKEFQLIRKTDRQPYQVYTTIPSGAEVYHSAKVDPGHWQRRGSTDAMGGEGVAVRTASGTWYFYLGDLPESTDPYNYGSVKLLANVGPWTGNARTVLDVDLASQGTFGYTYSVGGTPNTQDGIVVYQQGNLYKVFLVLSGSFKAGLVSTAYKYLFTGLPYDLQATGSETLPSGSKRFDSRDTSTYPPRATSGGGGGGGTSATNTDLLPEGSTNVYFTNPRVLAAPLTGLTQATTLADVTSSDTVLGFAGKFKKLFNSLGTAAYQAISAFAAAVHTHLASEITDLPTAVDARITAQKGAANGVAPLGSDSKIAATYLPSYVDDVIEATNLAAFPATGETGKMYIALDSNKTYRWSGSVYVEISPSPGSTDAVPEGAANKYYTDGRVLAAPLTGLTQATTLADITVADTQLTAWGKFKKLFNSLAAVALSGSYNDLTGKPTIPSLYTVLGENFASTTYYELGTFPITGDALNRAQLILRLFTMRSWGADNNAYQEYVIADRNSTNFGDNVHYWHVGGDSYNNRPAYLVAYQQLDNTFKLFVKVVAGSHKVGIAILFADQLTMPSAYTATTSTPSGTSAYDSSSVAPILKIDKNLGYLQRGIYRVHDDQAFPVQPNMTPSDTQVLTFVAANNRWEAANAAGGGGWTPGSVVNGTASGSIAWAWSTYQNQLTLTTSGSVALANPTSLAAGKQSLLIVKIGANGHTLTFGNAFVFTNGIVPDFPSDAGTTLVFELSTDGTSVFVDWVSGPVGLLRRQISATSYTFLQKDHGWILEFTAATAVTCTVPTGLPDKWYCGVRQVGAGKVTNAPSGTTINTYPSTALSTAGQWATATLECRGSNSFWWGGQTAV